MWDSILRITASFYVNYFLTELACLLFFIFHDSALKRPPICKIGKPNYR